MKRSAWVHKLVLLFVLVAWLGQTGCAPLTPPPRGERAITSIPFKHADRHDLRLDLYLPAGPGPHPLVYWIHGGGWKFGDKGWRLYVRDLTRYGFAVASVEYRLSGRARFPAQYDDCRDGLEFLLAHAEGYGLDRRNVFLAGTSAGAHLAALLGVRETRAKVNAVFAQYPATDLNGFDNQGARKGYLPALLGGPVTEHRALAIAGSPVTYVRANSPPFFFLHGQRDQLVPYQQSVKMHRLLLAAGVHSELVLLPEKEHGFPLSETQVGQVAAFFRKFVK